MKLNPRQKKILEMRVRDKMSYKRIGDEFDVTSERIRAVTDKILSEVYNENK